MIPTQKSLQDLLVWYSEKARNLPWRRSPINPYAVWISEVMSQQSTLTTVIPYFEKWMSRFPDLETLVAAPESLVLEYWAGLGYYSRARNLYKAAQSISIFKKNEGRWPQTFVEWSQFPGLGPYTAAAVAAIAFHAPVLPVDGNVIRVFARVLGLADPLNRSEEHRKIVAAVGDLARHPAMSGKHRQMAQALMELGALICRPGARALCDLCPLAKDCWARQHEKVLDIPRPKLRRATQRLRLIVPLYHGRRGGILLRQRPQGRRLAGQWELPYLEMDARSPWNQQLFEESFSVVGPLRHCITHHQYEVWVAEVGPWRGVVPKHHGLWSPKRPFASLQQLSTLTRKILLKKQLI